MVTLSLDKPIGDLVILIALQYMLDVRTTDMMFDYCEDAGL